MVTLVHFVEQCVAGIDTYVRSLLRAQINDPRFGRIIILTREGDLPFQDEPALLAPHVEIHHYPFSRSLLSQPRAFMGVRKALKQIDADIIYMHCSYPGLLGRLARLTSNLKAKFVYNAHSWSFEQDRGALIDGGFVMIERLLAPLTDAVITCSHASLFLAADRKVHFKDARVIQNGVKDCAVPPTTASGPADGPLRFGFVGRFDRQKGLPQLLEGFGACNRDDIELALVGWKVLNDASAIDGIDDDPRIKRLDRVPPSEIDAVYRQFDALIIPSRYEGLPLVALEAMRNACPLIVSDRTCMPYLVIPGFNGDVFNFNNPETLTPILDRIDRPTLKRWGMNARQVFAETYEETAMVDGANALLLSLVAADTPPAAPPVAE